MYIYLSYEQGQRGAETEGHFIWKTPHFPEHTAVVWFWRHWELKQVRENTGCPNSQRAGLCVWYAKTETPDLTKNIINEVYWKSEQRETESNLLIMQLIMNAPTRPHLPTNQWKKKNSQGPPISCMVVGSATQDLWGCRTDRARSQHKKNQIFVHSFSTSSVLL